MGLLDTFSALDIFSAIVALTINPFTTIGYLIWRDKKKKDRDNVFWAKHQGRGC